MSHVSLLSPGQECPLEKQMGAPGLLPLENLELCMNRASSLSPLHSPGLAHFFQTRNPAYVSNQNHQNRCIVYTHS